MQQYISEIILTSVLSGNRPSGWILDHGKGTRFFCFLGLCNSAFTTAYGCLSLVAEPVITGKGLYLYQGTMSLYSRIENSFTVVLAVISEIT